MDEKDKLTDSLEKLKSFCLDGIIMKFCNVIDDKLYKSLSEYQIKNLRKLVETIIDAN